MVLAKFDEHFVPKRNIIHERAGFHKRNQNQGETVESFARSLMNLLNTVILGPVGISKYGIGFSSESRTKNVSQKLQLKSDLTLQTVIQRARQLEMVKYQATNKNSKFKAKRR